MTRIRKQRLVNKNVQVGLTGSFITVAVVCAMFQVLLVNRSLNQLADKLSEPEVLLETLPNLLMTNLLITLGTLLPAMWFFGVYITHRIAGPVYRFERYFEGLARGEYEGPCMIREGDELWELCDKINAGVERLRVDGGLANHQAPEASADNRAAAGNDRGQAA